MAVEAEPVRPRRALTPYARALLAVPVGCALATALVLLYLADPLDPAYVVVNGGPEAAARRDLLGLAFFVYQLLAPLALAVLVMLSGRRAGPPPRVVVVACGVYLVASVVVLGALAHRVGWALALVRFLPPALILLLVPFAVVLGVSGRRRDR